MSRLGNSLDNYPIEHHFSFLKQECLNFIKWNDRNFKNVYRNIKDYYKWFNNERIYKNSNNKIVVNKLVYNHKESGLNLLA
jgi:putative transposase